MKRVNFKSILMALAVTVSFLLAGADHGYAQGLSGGGSVFDTPTGTFLNSDLAEQKLFTAMNADRQSLQFLPYGSPAYNQTYNRAMLFGYIYFELRDNANATVPNAIVEGLKKMVIVDNGITPGLSPKQLTPLRNDAIQFLKN